MTGESQHRGKQGHRGGHHEQHGQRRADGQPTDERHADQEQPEQGDHYGATGEQHGPPARVDRVHHRVLGIATFVQTLAVPGADEQRVVDAHADADQRRDLRSERRNVQDSGEQIYEREADPDAEDRGHDGHAHREQRAERDQQDDDGGENPDRLARGLRLLREHRAAQLDLEPRRVCILGDRSHVRCKVERDVVRPHVEQDFRVRNPAPLSDEAGARGFVRRRDADDVRFLAQLREDGFDLASHIGRVDVAGPTHSEDEIAGVAFARELAFEDAERAVRFGTGQRERLEQVAPDRLAEHADDDECDDPPDDHASAAAVAPRGQASEHGPSLCALYRAADRRSAAITRTDPGPTRSSS